jgi:HlyD family secretion protein
MSSRALQLDVKPRSPGPDAVVRLRVQGLVWVLAYLLLLTLGLAGCGGNAMPPSGTAVAPPAAAPGLEGHVMPLETVEIGSLVSGLVAQVDCDEGQAVRAGQRCARIDGRALDTAVQREEAAVRAARAREAKDRLALAYATTILARARELVPDGVVSQESVDADDDALSQARAQVEVDVAEVARAQAMLRAARLDAGHADIVSPIDGVIAERRVSVGQALVATQQAPTLFVVDSGPGRLAVDVAMACSGDMPPPVGTPAMVAIDGRPGASLRGRVRRVDNGSRCVSGAGVRVLSIGVDDPDHRLAVGQRVRVRLEPSAAEGR